MPTKPAKWPVDRHDRKNSSARPSRRGQSDAMMGFVTRLYPETLGLCPIRFALWHCRPAATRGDIPTSLGRTATATAFTPGRRRRKQSALWRLTRRHWKVLLACAVVSFGIAYLAGSCSGQAASGRPRRRCCISRWRCPKSSGPRTSIRLVCRRWPGGSRNRPCCANSSTSFIWACPPTTSATVFMKVEQPAGTESIVVDFKWPDAAVRREGPGPVDGTLHRLRRRRPARRPCCSASRRWTSRRRMLARTRSNGSTSGLKALEEKLAQNGQALRRGPRRRQCWPGRARAAVKIIRKDGKQLDSAKERSTQARRSRRDGRVWCRKAAETPGEA